jgi:nitrite reductase/ring-hydroxylating ferredoxin subunit
VLFRTAEGRPVAMRNRCPHRSFPLAKGKLVGDTLVCGYHGMAFNADGMCTHMPALNHAPASAAVRTFPIVDRGPLSWIWLGPAHLADEALIPETPWLTDAGWGTVTGDFHIKADYVGMHENLIDQTHFPFLHPDTVGTPEFARSKLTAKVEGDQVVIQRRLDDAPPPAVYGKPAGIMHKRVTRTSEARFVGPAMHTAYAEIIDAAPEADLPGRYCYYITHVFTPESNTSIHYWWFNSRDFRPQDPAIDDFMHQASSKAYLEDVDALEWIMEVVERDQEQQFDMSFAPDRPGLMARRIIYRKAMAEVVPGES